MTKIAFARRTNEKNEKQKVATKASYQNDVLDEIDTSLNYLSTSRCDDTKNI